MILEVYEIVKKKKSVVNKKKKNQNFKKKVYSEIDKY